MAGAEARAVWQRAANRCFVQEDAKRAPKLACCQSSCSTKQVDGGPTSAADLLDHPPSGFMPFNQNPSFSNLPPDTRWWLQLQPSYGYQNGLSYEQINALEAEVENLRAGIMSSPSKPCEVDPQVDCTFVGGNKNKDSFLDLHCKMSSDSKVERAQYDKNALNFGDLKVIRKNTKQAEMESIECLKSQKSSEYSFDLESSWMGGEKNVPWWRITDKDDLASLVAQKSLNFMENCDLPPPQKTYVRTCPCSFDRRDTQASLDWKAQSGHATGQNISQGCPSAKSKHGREKASIEGHSQSNSGKSYSYTKTCRDTAESGQLSEGDPCKAQLLEALCHSQTRAREAEKMAKQAFAEKEDIIKLFFRQASQLFAYKQWFRLLQLETLYYQLKNSDQPMSTFFPVVLPWVPQKGGKPRKTYIKGKRKRDRQGNDIGRYAVAFALGLSLVGAGLLLGWSVGWMLPF